MSKEVGTYGPVGTCRVCGKLCFRSRKDCRRYMKRKHPSSGVYEYMSTYQCGGYWHYGHTPYEVARGLRGREHHE